MVGLLPCQENSPAPSEMSGMLRRASSRLLVPRCSRRSEVTTVIDCGVSSSGCGNLESERSSGLKRGVLTTTCSVGRLWASAGAARVTRLVPSSAARRSLVMELSQF